MFKDSNYNICRYDDPVSFRYKYEVSLREVERANRPTTLIVISSNQFNQVPYDIYLNANRIILSTELIFPKFASSVVQQLPITLYPNIFEAHSRSSKLLSDDETARFILQEVYSIEPSLLVDEVTVIKAALSYYEEFNEPMPKVLVTYLSDNLTKVSSSTFGSFTSREALSRRLNDEWKAYIDSYLKNHIREESISDFENYFTDTYIRKHLEEYINPIEVFSDANYEDWMSPGLIIKDAGIEYIKNEEKDLFNKTFDDFDRVGWVEFASKLGQLQFQLLRTGQLDAEFKENVAFANDAFEKWMGSKYQDLSTLPLLPKPKMLHQVPWYIEQKLRDKAALIVMDGMSYTQWYQIKEVLSEDNWKFAESGTFSWVPTITPVARQAIFSGKVPREYGDSISSTNKEGKLWRDFWIKHGFQEQAIAYQKSLGLNEFKKDTFPFVTSPFIKIYGGVIDVIDKFMHGAKQGNRTMISELDNWLNTGYLQEFLGLLVSEGFDIYLTSDHGNIESQGRGRINQGVTVESANQRLRIYKSESIRKSTAETFSDTLIWDNINLPDDYHVLLARNNDAFVPINDKIITHGGIHIEEVIVPFVKIYC